MSWKEQFQGWNRDNWVSVTHINGIGMQKPRHEKDMLQTALANSNHPKYAWDVLTKGVCDGCALGVAGLHDWTMDGIHLCTTRLRLLEMNTADPLDPVLLSDVEPLRSRTGEELRSMGRLGVPMRRRRGEAGFRPIGWEEALGALASGLRAAGPDRSALYLTSRGITNETYYSAAKASRAMGINNVDSAARVCHAPSTLGLKSTVGVSATTCSLTDVLESDLLVLWGANPGNNQPVMMKHLYLARKNGLRIVVVNPYLEPGLDRYWVPSTVESFLFGTKFCDLHIPVRPGGDVALALAVMQKLVEWKALDQRFIDEHTTGFDDMLAALDLLSHDDLCTASGVSAELVEAFAREYADASAAILCWSMGITQHVDAVDGVQAIVNLALARGNVGRNGAGLMPLRGHSGVQGGAEMGAYATALPGGLPVNAENAAAIGAKWGFEIPSEPGLTTAEMLEAAERGELDVLWTSGGNFREVLPDPVRVDAAMAKIPLRVHADIVVSSQMLEPGDDVILLPVNTRYEQEGGGTSTTTERRIAFSPEIPRRVGEARSEWRLFADVAARVRPDLRAAFAWPTNQDLRAEIAAVVPDYEGIQHLSKTGDNVQWGGRHLCADGNFPTPDGRGKFSVLTPGSTEIPAGMFTVATRRGKQFNSMVQAAKDPLTGAVRDEIFIDAADAAAMGLAAGATVRLTSETGSYDGRLRIAKLPAQCLQVHWPEANVLLASGPQHREPGTQVPDYNALVTVTPL